LAEDEAGALWTATEGGGLDRLDPATGGVRHFLHDPSRPHSLSSDLALDLLVDGSGVLWVGTQAGLNRLEDPSAEPAEARFRRYSEQDGLPSNLIRAIEADSEGFLWLATDRGLSRFDPRTASFKTYDRSHGLQDDEFNHNAHYRSAGGELFFGGPNGVNTFFPDRIEDNTFVPPIVLTSFLKLNQPFDLGRPIYQVDEVRLDYRDTVISFEFAALEYTAPQKNRYAYLLEGLTEDWIDLGNTPQATFTSLAPGRYVLRIKGSNNDGVWNEEGVELAIAVAPPPWKSWWAYTLYVLALAAVLVGFLRSQQRKVERQRAIAELERAGAERERAVSRQLREVDKLKDEFLANTSHELRTPLNGITGLAESLIDGVAGEVPAAVKSNLSMIVQSGRRLGHLVGDILDFSKLRHKSLELDPRPVDLRPMVEVVLTLSRPLVGSKELELASTVPADLPAVMADENRLQQILHNLVGNAVKFTESGSVEVSATADDERVVVRVTDTGIGIPAETQERIFDAFEQADASIERAYGGTGLGPAATRQLVELHGGALRAASTPG
ncbi:MAG: GGDEF domain-containing protein, partial [Actinomycetia bacterium]|nr:GGDEF domain-containing protein [Actinomycetes bacterium]